jgi:hypothetical protein
VADVPHDWLGSEIAIGTRVIWRSSKTWGVGTVTALRREYVAGAPGVRTSEMDEWVLDIAWELKQPYMEMAAEPSTEVGKRIRIENVTVWSGHAGKPEVRP